MKKILICTPTYNESENIKNFCKQIYKIKNIDLLVIDDNSPDGTSEIIMKLKKKYNRLFLLKREKKMGIGSAIRAGMNYAIKNNYYALITMDADLSHQPKEIPSFIKKIQNHDFVTGSRYMIGGKSNYKGYRDFISRLANKSCRILLKMPFKEYTTSYRAYNKKSLKILENAVLWSDGYSSQIEFIFYIYQAKLKCLEIPIDFQDRTRGNSKIPRLQAFYGCCKLIELFLKRITFSKKKNYN